MNLLQRITDVIPKCQILIKYTETYLLVVTNVRTLLSLNIVNWKRNRPAEMDRCREIAKDIANARPFLDSLFYLYFIDTPEGVSGSCSGSGGNSCSVSCSCSPRFECLDGIHRYTALTLLHKEYTKPIDLLDDDMEAPSLHLGGSMEWLYGRTVLLNIRTGCDEQELATIFRNINNCVPVPITYLEEYDERKRKCAETIAFEYQMKYRPHFVVEKSAQYKPNRPNTTHNRVVNMITDLYDEWKEKEAEDADITSTIRGLLENANLYIQNHLVVGVPLPMLEKCRKTGCYLFLYKPAEILEIIGRIKEGMVLI